MSLDLNNLPKWGWIGVDFDGTLVHYDKWRGADHVGSPVLPMIERVGALIHSGYDVRIFTARIWPILHVPVDLDASPLVWLPSHGGAFGNPKRNENAKLAVKVIRRWAFETYQRILPITCVKDFEMVALFDDRAVQVVPNEGRIVGA